jgi:hypothetical protein
MSNSEGELAPFHPAADCSKCAGVNTLQPTIRIEASVAHPFEYLGWHCSRCGATFINTRTADSRWPNAEG